MDVTEIPAGSIVVGVDGSDSAGRALAWAAAQACLERRPLTLLHAFGPLRNTWLTQTGLDQRTWSQAVLADAHAILERAHQDTVALAPELEATQVVRLVDARLALVEASERAWLLVVGSRGLGPLRGALLGSVSAAVARRTSCPVVVVRPTTAEREHRGVLVGVDGSARSAAPLLFAYRQASLHRLPLTVVHGYWDVPAFDAHGSALSAGGLEDARRSLAESVSGLAETFNDVPVTTELAHGLADDWLVTASSSMDLVVVGAHHGGLRTAVTRGSVADAVVEHARCPVAVIPPDGRARQAP